MAPQWGETEAVSTEGQTALVKQNLSTKNVDFQDIFL